MKSLILVKKKEIGVASRRNSHFEFVPVNEFF